MKREASSFSWLFSALLMVIVVAIAFTTGCRLIDFGGDSSSDTATSTISGRVVKGASGSIRGSESVALLAADVAGGTYLFTDVPAGEHRVVISYLDDNGDKKKGSFRSS